MELKPSNRPYTWSNNQDDPILAALDRVFVTTDWEQHFPLVSVQALSRVFSDHTSLIIDTSHASHLTPKLFRFEKGWLS
jgi:endonuclease/exonuclease/phosphatase family metal-dependent hydrolase